MNPSIRNRLLIIGALMALSIYSLFPRDVTIRSRGPDGALRDTTEKKIPLKLGLDLQGGMHLGLELDQTNRVSSDVSRDIDLALTVLRKRVDEFGVQEPVVQKVGDERIVVELAGVRDPQRAMDIVQKAAFLEFRITDRTGALDKALPAMDRALRGLGITAAAGKTSPSAVQSLLGGDSAAAGADSTPVEGGALSSLIQPGAAAGSGVPGEYFVPEAAYPRVDSLFRIPEVARALPRGVEILWSAAPVSVGVQPYRFFYVVEDKPIVTGRNLVDASAQFDQLTNGPVVHFELDRAGGRQFGAATQAHIGDYMAIVLDGRVQGPPPVIQGRIDRNGQITMGGGKSIVEAQDLALTLKAGALPVPLKIVDRFQVGASLGADSIRGGITAGIIGTLVVILIMIGYYRMSGVLAVGALALYLLFTLGGLAMIDATLTLPGLAGIVLSIGIAVDANVLIFERIREELIHGRTVRLAVDEGFQHAMSAIIDSNVSTVITALFLFQFGTGPVKGFAVTLTMGIFASMITAVFVSKTFFMIWLQRRPDLTTLSI
ncbi:MAG TPA: protein translocase subunit SecD [Gemmatimonadales bacterium]|nr:protein translocase subunit SecD [Gemmatimonadales bacterium]